MRILLMGATPSFVMQPNDSVSRKLEKTGWNTGNQIIAYGLLQTLRYDEVSWDYSIDPKELSQRCDMIVAILKCSITKDIKYAAKRSEIVYHHCHLLFQSVYWIHKVLGQQ